MTLHDYEMRLFHWNEAHDDGTPEVVDPAITEKQMAKLREHPELLTRTVGEKPVRMPARL